MDAIRKVLVVDDDPVVGKSFDRVLSGKGYAVIHAHDGEEALSKLRDEKYDVVFTDIKMPGMNGLEVAEKVKASQPWLPVVIITGYGTEANEAQAKAAGVKSFLHKPLSPEMIEDSARAALLESAAAAAPAESSMGHAPEIAATVEEAKPATVGTFIKNVALFIAAPFIGLAYMIAMPFIGLGVLAWMGGKELMKNRVVRNTAVGVKNVGMIVAAPVIGLAYIIAMPFIGLVMLAWMGARALVKRSGPQ
jgi:CheY-like chemotaxis protein